MNFLEFCARKRARISTSELNGRTDKLIEDKFIEMIASIGSRTVIVNTQSDQWKVAHFMIIIHKAKSRSSS